MLSKIGAMIGKYILDFFYNKIAAFISEWFARQKREEETKKQAEQQTQPLKDAKTGEEIDKAIDDALSKF